MVAKINLSIAPMYFGRFVLYKVKVSDLLQTLGFPQAINRAALVEEKIKASFGCRHISGSLLILLASDVGAQECLSRKEMLSFLSNSKMMKCNSVQKNKSSVISIQICRCYVILHHFNNDAMTSQKSSLGHPWLSFGNIEDAAVTSLKKKKIHPSNIHEDMSNKISIFAFCSWLKEFVVRWL